ncbi:protein of unknown function DUF86 [Caldicellulosiruptor kronotskyensis 2002]|uniref:DUF86 domain-containing protein n=1 Tax=Caldicellulosiruptor kronotskyensis (strain DSM 18902 / VKM B-2412 / 2002) TaxID=632348 RepID=E4SCH9_CALK2|nr:DUF86 domain-containing protein [Caldicellulosiruptor kronotskyensis]ADQ45913.1 protein of unknown function DUF86 [Caldicellulosiruptor kronotskyensis 2002]
MNGREVIIDKISKIMFRMKRIERFKSITFENFKDISNIQDVVAYNLFLIAQNLISLCNRIIAEKQFKVPENFEDIPEILATEKVISDDSSVFIKKMIDLRNTIVYEYTQLDLNVIYDILKNGLDEIKNVLKEIVDYLKL